MWSFSRQMYISKDVRTQRESRRISLLFIQEASDPDAGKKRDKNHMEIFYRFL
jgi:hypothetical protein